jgi:hypothetical protein
MDHYLQPIKMENHGKRENPAATVWISFYILN